MRGRPLAHEKLSRSSPLTGALALGAARACALLSPRARRALGGGLGHLAWRLPNAPRRVTRLNLAWCLPELSPGERRRLARTSLIETGRTMVESAALLGSATGLPEPLERRVDGEEHLHAALAGGRGALLFLPHLGNWEMMNPFLMRRTPFAALYRPPRTRQLDRLVIGGRERFGCSMIPATARGLRRIYRVLGEGLPVVILPDQEPVRRSGVFAPFFGIPALTGTLAARLLRSLKVPALFGFALRTAEGRFDFHFRPAPEGLDDPDPERAAARLNLAVEECVRVCPEQYVWSYKRFKTRPREEERRLREDLDPTGVLMYQRRKGMPEPIWPEL